MIVNALLVPSAYKSVTTRTTQTLGLPAPGIDIET